VRAKVIQATVSFLVGLALIWGGLTLATDDGVSCEIGGPSLQPGQTCANALPRGRGVVVSDYEEQRAGNQRAGWVGVGFGVLFLVLGASILFRRNAKGDGGNPNRLNRLA
jgi:hypothetical protein